LLGCVVRGVVYYPFKDSESPPFIMMSF